MLIQSPLPLPENSKLVKKFLPRITPALLLLLVLLLPFPVKAASLDLTVSPVSLDYSPKPGDVIQDKVTIHNNGTEALNLSLSVSKMSVDAQGNVSPAEIVPGDPAAKWIKFNTSKITAPVKEWYEVPFTINIPSDAAYGNYFALVFSAETQKPGTGTTLVQSNVLIPVLLNVQKEGALRQAVITEFRVNKFVSEYLPVDFSVTVKNTGNLHVHPRGNLFIKGTSQKDLAKLEVNPGMGNILPGSSRTFTAGWNDSFIVRNPDNHLTFNWNKLTDFRIGKYSAYVLLSYDDGQRDVPIDATITFWVFPYTAVIVILVTIVLFISLIVYVFKSQVRKAAQKIQPR
jgi:hypothetical protein